MQSIPGFLLSYSSSLSLSCNKSWPESPPRSRTLWTGCQESCIKPKEVSAAWHKWSQPLSCLKRLSPSRVWSRKPRELSLSDRTGAAAWLNSPTRIWYRPGQETPCADTLCEEGPCGCLYCGRDHSNTRTVRVESRNGEGGWTNWGEYTFPSSPGGSHDYWSSKIPATQVRITFLNTYGQWRTSYPCRCFPPYTSTSCGDYVFLREAQVFGDNIC